MSPPCRPSVTVMTEAADLVRAEVELEDLLGVQRTWNHQLAGMSLSGDSRPERPVSLRLGLLAAEAHRRELLSEGQLARLLRFGRVDLRKILDAASVIDGAAGIKGLPHEAERPRRA